MLVLPAGDVEETTPSDELGGQPLVLGEPLVCSVPIYTYSYHGLCQGPNMTSLSVEVKKIHRTDSFERV